MIETKILEIHTEGDKTISKFYREMAMIIEDGWTLVKSDILYNSNNYAITYIALFKRENKSINKLLV